jgi:hypothetical protein
MNSTASSRGVVHFTVSPEAGIGVRLNCYWSQWLGRVAKIGNMTMATDEDHRQLETATELTELSRALALSTLSVPRPSDSGSILAELRSTAANLARVCEQLESWNQNVEREVHYLGDNAGALEASYALDEATQYLRGAADSIRRAHTHSNTVRWLGAQAGS